MRRKTTLARRCARRWRRVASAWRAMPVAARVVSALAGLAVLTVAYQVIRKPTEVFAIVPSSAKGTRATWSAYGAFFREHSTDLIPPELLAALVQAESAGDPLARTFWRWRWSWNPLDLYGPASSSVGLLQITEGTFAEASRLCIHDHRVVREGPWRDLRACGFNRWYVRWSASDAIEMTSAWLDQSTRQALGGRLARTAPAQRRHLAAVIHLCGRNRGASFARRGFRVAAGERCGEHDLAAYLARVDRLTAEFARFAGA